MIGGTRRVAIALVAVALLGAAAQPLRATTRILLLGDSITRGYPIPGGYRDPLMTGLIAGGWQFQFIGSHQIFPTPAMTDAGQASHEGHDGYRIDQITANLNGDDGQTDSNGGHWLEREGVPDVILLHIGTNDVLQGYQIATMGDRLEVLLDSIHAILPDVRVLLSSIVPIAGNSVANAIVQTFNGEIESQIVPAQQALGRRIGFVDQYANFVDEDGAILAERLADFAHPNEIGYEAMAATWLQALEAVLPMTFSQWRERNFSAAQIADATISGATADYDQDGLSTLLEWFHALNPLVNDACDARRGEVGLIGDSVTGERWLQMTYRASDRVSGAGIEWEGCEDLASDSWELVDADTQALGLGGEGFTDVRVRIAIPPSAKQFFLRLRVEASLD